MYDAPPFIPSLNTKIALTKHLDLRLAYARGFRSPSLRELYFNFFDANHQIVGNPDLKAETSNSFTGSLTWKKILPGEVIYTTVLGGFYNHIKNMIDYSLDARNPNVFILTNVSDSKTAGVNLSTVVKYKKWNLSLGASYTGFYNDYSAVDESLPVLQWSPELNSTIGYSFARIGVDVNLFYKFTGKRPSYIQKDLDVVLTEMESYHWADLTVNKKAFKFLTVNAGIRNLFDVDRVRSTSTASSVHTASGINSIGSGRAFFAGVVFNWERTK